MLRTNKIKVIFDILSKNSQELSELLQSSEQTFFGGIFADKFQKVYDDIWPIDEKGLKKFGLEEYLVSIIQKINIPMGDGILGLVKNKLTNQENLAALPPAIMDLLVKTPVEDMLQQSDNIIALCGDINKDKQTARNIFYYKKNILENGLKGLEKQLAIYGNIEQLDKEISQLSINVASVGEEKLKKEIEVIKGQIAVLQEAKNNVVNKHTGNNVLKQAGKNLSRIKKAIINNAEENQKTKVKRQAEKEAIKEMSQQIDDLSEQLKTKQEIKKQFDSLKTKKSQLETLKSKVDQLSIAKYSAMHQLVVGWKNKIEEAFKDVKFNDQKILAQDDAKLKDLLEVLKNVADEITAEEHKEVFTTLNDGFANYGARVIAWFKEEKALDAIITFLNNGYTKEIVKKIYINLLTEHRKAAVEKAQKEGRTLPAADFEYKSKSFDHLIELLTFVAEEYKSYNYSENKISENDQKMHLLVRLLQTGKAKLLLQDNVLELFKEFLGGFNLPTTDNQELLSALDFAVKALTIVQSKEIIPSQSQELVGKSVKDQDKEFLNQLFANIINETKTMDSVMRLLEDKDTKFIFQKVYLYLLEKNNLLSEESRDNSENLSRILTLLVFVAEEYKKFNSEEYPVGDGAKKTRLLVNLLKNKEVNDILLDDNVIKIFENLMQDVNVKGFNSKELLSMVHFAVEALKIFKNHPLEKVEGLDDISYLKQVLLHIFDNKDGAKAITRLMENSTTQDILEKAYYMLSKQPESDKNKKIFEKLVNLVRNIAQEYNHYLLDNNTVKDNKNKILFLVRTIFINPESRIFLQDEVFTAITNIIKSGDYFKEKTANILEYITLLKGLLQIVNDNNSLKYVKDNKIDIKYDEEFLINVAKSFSTNKKLFAELSTNTDYKIKIHQLFDIEFVTDKLFGVIQKRAEGYLTLTEQEAKILQENAIYSSENFFNKQVSSDLGELALKFIRTVNSDIETNKSYRINFSGLVRRKMPASMKAEAIYADDAVAHEDFVILNRVKRLVLQEMTSKNIFLVAFWMIIDVIWDVITSIFTLKLFSTIDKYMSLKSFSKDLKEHYEEIAESCIKGFDAKYYKALAKDYIKDFDENSKITPKIANEIYNRLKDKIFKQLLFVDFLRSDLCDKLLVESSQDIAILIHNMTGLNATLVNGVFSSLKEVINSMPEDQQELFKTADPFVAMGILANHINQIDRNKKLQDAIISLCKPGIDLGFSAFKYVSLNSEEEAKKISKIFQEIAKNRDKSKFINMNQVCEEYHMGKSVLFKDQTEAIQKIKLGNLSGCIFEESLDLSNLRLCGLDFSHTKFSGHLNLSKSDLRGSNFTKISLEANATVSLRDAIFSSRQEAVNVISCLGDKIMSSNNRIFYYEGKEKIEAQIVDLQLEGITRRPSSSNIALEQDNSVKNKILSRDAEFQKGISWTEKSESTRLLGESNKLCK